jgi:glycosyltransferase involved in cell wall biosynthesis
MKTCLAAIGDANDPTTWSGIPYHFLKAAQKVGLVDEGLRLCIAGGQRAVRRAAWSGFQLLRGRRYGGYQYQPCFLERLFSPIRGTIAGARVINCFQLFPPSVVRDGSVEKWFFIDMTLRQLFACYGAALDYRTAAEAIAREAEGFQKAEMVIAHSAWAARSVTDDYGIPAERVRVVVPGANFDPLVYAAWDKEQQMPGPLAAGQPIKLVFVGKYWERKGLDRLLRALRIARHRGAAIELRVIGLAPADVPPAYRNEPGVEWSGFLDKRTDAGRFLRAVASADLGCLLSRAEAGGIVLREFHALGLPVIGPAIGGSPDHMFPGASIPVPPDAPDEAIGDILVRLCKDRSALEQMRERAWNSRHEALWDATCRRILDFWPDRNASVVGKSAAAAC